MHYGWASDVRKQPAVVLSAAYAAHPERFVHAMPQPPRLPDAAWINKPIAEVPATARTTQ